MKKTPGKFITFEGLDGCGKTTQIQRLSAALRTQGHDVLITREPGGTAVGEKVRAILLDSRTSGLSPMAELALMFASRAQQIQEVILPGLKAGKIVLCDRFTDSSEAYQGGGRQLGSQHVLALHKIICGGLQPDLTILLLADAKTSVVRARNRNQRSKRDEGRFETENPHFFRRVLKGYLRIAAREPQRLAKINASQSIADVHKDILKTFHTRFASKKLSK